MESAVESGKITANYILDKYNKPNIEHYKHEAAFYIKCIQNIANVMIIVIFIFILYRYYPLESDWTYLLTNNINE